MIFKDADITRFWSKVKREKENDCWHWQGGIHWASSLEVRNRYGVFHANNKKYRAHRVSYAIINGIIPDGHVVRHKCDNPKCCNPAHLETGTQQENDMDRIIRGRTRNGHTGRIK